MRAEKVRVTHGRLVTMLYREGEKPRPARLHLRREHMVKMRALFCSKPRREFAPVERTYIRLRANLFDNIGRVGTKGMHSHAYASKVLRNRCRDSEKKEEVFHAIRMRARGYLFDNNGGRWVWRDPINPEILAAMAERFASDRAAADRFDARIAAIRDKAAGQSGLRVHEETP